MKNLINHFGKLTKLAAFLSVAHFYAAGTAYAGPPAQSGPNVFREQTPAWFWYGNEEYIVFHGRDLVQQCINAFIAQQPVPIIFTGTWHAQYVFNPQDGTRVSAIAKSGEDVETWIFPSSYFEDENGPYSDLQVCSNLLFPFGWPDREPHPEVAKGFAHVIGRDNNLLGSTETKGAHSRSMSAQGMLMSPDESVGDVMFNGGFHCVASQDITEEKCRVRVNLN